LRDFGRTPRHGVLREPSRQAPAHAEAIHESQEFWSNADRNARNSTSHVAGRNQMSEFVNKKNRERSYNQDKDIEVHRTNTNLVGGLLGKFGEHGDSGVGAACGSEQRFVNTISTHPINLALTYS
jgi:hypothetical protein